MSRSPMAKLAVSPVLTALFGVTAPQYRRLPAELASWMPKATTVPQLALACGKVIAVPLAFAPPDAAGQLVALLVTSTRSYDPPVTSVPPPASFGVAVNSEMYTVPGRV